MSKEASTRVTRLSLRKNSSKTTSETLAANGRVQRTVAKPSIVVEISDDDEEWELKPIKNKTESKVRKPIKSKTKAGVELAINETDSQTKSIESSPKKVNITPKKNKSMDKGLIAHGSVTPPKQKKLAGDENTPFSPSRLLEKLNLNASPRKSLNFNSNVPKNAYQSARKALHSTVPDEMPGREKELETLKGFIKNCLENEKSASLYVSGPPGTGKTASLSKILQENEINNQFKEVYINCTAIKSSAAIYSKIVSELGIKTNSKTERDLIAAIERYLNTKHKMILLVLDEIDQLESRKQSVLYTIFEWPSKENSKLVLIGIANALDLTDRILPRLKAHCELKPELMHFAAYSKEQIVAILTQRLKSAGVSDVFHPAAVQMLAAKVAAISGDIRRALDIGRRVVEIVEEHKSSSKTLKSVENLVDVVKKEANNELLNEKFPKEQLNNGISDENIKNEPIKSENIKSETIKSVELKHVVNVLNSVYGTSNNFANDGSEDTFPLQQKIIVCALLLIVKKARNKSVTIGRLHEVYRKVCAKKNIQLVDYSEFIGLCSLIETKGILRIGKKTEARLRKVHLEWDEEEVSSILKDKPLMAMILEDSSVLGKM